MSIGLIGVFLFFFERVANIHKFRIYADKFFFIGIFYDTFLQFQQIFAQKNLIFAP